MSDPYLIGLTGNIASGKSTVARLLRALGAAILDADALVHELYAPATEVTRRIAATFGQEVLAPDGGVDRRRLAARVLGDPPGLRRLEAIVHPAVAALRQERLQAIREPVVVIEAVKLVEAGQHRLVDALWVVVCDEAEQRRRLVEERGLSEAEARARLAAQPPLAEKLRLADVVIDNRGTREDLRRQVEAAWRRTVPGTQTGG